MASEICFHKQREHICQTREPLKLIKGLGAHPRRPREAKGLGNGTQIQCVHIEDVLELVRIVGKDVASVCILGALVQVVVLLHELLQLALHVGDLALGEVKLIEWDSCFLQGDRSEGVYLGAKQYSFRLHSHYTLEITSLREEPSSRQTPFLHCSCIQDEHTRPHHTYVIKRPMRPSIIASASQSY